jgi:hypothetical protein
MKVFISGKITGLSWEETEAKFAAAETKLREIGAQPINPLKLGIPKTATTDEALPHCFKAMKHCQAIFLLTDSNNNSRGCEAELKEAQRLRLDIYWETMDDYETIADLVKVGLVG